MGTTGYFVFNLKEYYTGEYFLQEINAIDEGSLLFFCFYMFAAFVGWESLQEPWLLGLKPFAFIFYPTLVQQIVQNFNIVVEIMTSKEYEVEYKPV